MCKISKKISDRRKQLGLTLEDVGQAVGVSKSTVQRWESGLIKNMGRDKIAALATVLRMNAVELVPGPSDFNTVRIEVQRKKNAMDIMKEATVNSRRLEVNGSVPQSKIYAKVEADPQFKSMMKLWEVSTPEARKLAIDCLKISAGKKGK